MLGESEFRTMGGKLFNMLGVQTEKARSARVIRVRGTTSVGAPAERRVLVEEFSRSNSRRHNAFEVERTLNVISDN